MIQKSNKPKRQPSSDPPKNRGKKNPIQKSAGRSPLQNGLQMDEGGFKQFLEAVPDGLVIVNTQGEIQFVNKQIEGMFGYLPEEMLGKPIELLIPDRYTGHKENREGYLNNLHARLMGSGLVLFAARKDQTEFQAEISLSPLKTEERTYIIAAIRDVSLQKLSEKQLKQSLERYQQTLDNMLEGCQIIDFDWRYIYINDLAASQGRRKPEEMLMRTMMETYPGIENTELFTVLKHCMEERILHKMENEFVYPDGSTGWFELSIQPVPEGIFILSIDITERKRTEEALRHSKEETTHANRLLLALSHAAQAVQRARTTEEVYSAIQDQVTQMGYSASGFELSEDGRSLRIAYLSYRADLVRKAEKMIGLSPRNFHFHPRVDSVYQRVIGKGETVFVKNAAQAVADTLPKKLRILAGPMADLFKLGQSIFTPLKVDDKTIGLMAFTGPGLTEADNPAVTAFASQAAIAIQNARLYEHAQQEITERKQAEESLVKSEKRFRALVEKSMEEVSMVGADGTLIFESPTTRRPLGYPPGSFLGHNLFELFHPDDQIVAIKLLEQIIGQPGSHREAQFRLRHQDGSWRWMEGIVTNMLDEPAVGAVVINYRDVTERRQAEEEIQSLARFPSENPNPVIRLTPDGRILYANKASTPLLDSWGRQVGQTVGDEWQEYIREAFASGEDKEVEIDCTGLIFSCILAPIREAGDINLYGRDITERKQAEMALRESEYIFRSFLEQSEDAIMLANNHGMLIQWSKGAEKLTGFSREESLGQPIWDIQFRSAPDEFKSTENFKHIKAVLQAALLTGKGTPLSNLIEAEIQRPDGTRLTTQTLAFPVHTDKGFLLGSILRDITERKQAEDTLHDSREELYRLLNSMAEGAYGVDTNGNCTFVNRAFLQILGHQNDHGLLGKHIHEIIHHSHSDGSPYPSSECRMYCAHQTNQPINVTDEVFWRKDGVAIPVEYWSYPIVKDGVIIGSIATFIDITERKQAEEELRTLYELSRALTDADDLDEILNQVNRHAVESVHTTFARVALLEGDNFVMRAAYPVRVLDHDLLVGKREPVEMLPYCQRVLEGNKSVILRNNSQEVSSHERAALLLDFAQTLCLIPLRVGRPGLGSKQTLGLLMLGEARSESREPFTPAKILLSESIGDQAAIAIRRMLLHEQTERRLQHLTALREIDQVIASSFDLDLSLRTVLIQVTEQLRVDATAVWLFNPASNLLEYSAKRGFHSKAFEQAKPLRLGEGYAGRAALERRTIHISNLTAQEDNPSLISALAEETFVSYYSVPLIAKGNIKGVLEVFHRIPLEPDEEWLGFLHTLAGQAAIAIDNATLFENLQSSNSDLIQAYDTTLEGWSAALDLRDKETEGHTQRVTEITVKLAEAMGFNQQELVQVRRGALLHDIGKMGVPDRILLKPDKLTDEEWEVMRMHPTYAYQMLKPITYLGSALDIPYGHHEKWDGTGYPRGLKGEDIPLAARVFAVVDIYDALTSDRPYRKSWTSEKTLNYIRELSGTHLDPRVVEAFLKMVSEDD